MRLGAILEADLSNQVREVIRREKSRQAATNKQWRQDNPEHWSGLRRAASEAHRQRKTRQAPKWADRYEINSSYIQAAKLRARTGRDYQVDHIIPLHGKTVSGLHIHTNMRIVEAHVNMHKSNKMKDKYTNFAPTKPNRYLTCG